MATLSLLHRQHQKTGKMYISSMEMHLSYKGLPIIILLNDSNISINIIGKETGKYFERSTPLIQLLYHIIEVVGR